MYSKFTWNFSLVNYIRNLITFEINYSLSGWLNLDEFIFNKFSKSEFCIKIIFDSTINLLLMSA